MISECCVCMHAFINHSVFVDHLLCTKDDPNPWKYSGERINVNFVLPQNLNYIGAWTNGTQVNKDNFKYSCQSIITNE